jgi:diguanylate cyclase (GGDEF)-like protein
MKEDTLRDQDLQALVYTDELTRIHNLRYFREQIPLFLEEAGEKGWTVALLMFDIDDFKHVNDRYGHPVGDQALVHFTEIISREIAPDGRAIRYAGDEFVLVIPQADKVNAAKIGEDIQQNIDKTPLRVNNQELTIKCSIGVSVYPQDGENLKTLFEKADEALYVAKEQGKSKIVITPDSGRLLTPSKLNSILKAPYIVGRDNLVEFLDDHLSPEGNAFVFPVLIGGEGTGKTRLMKYARDTAQKKLGFTLYAKGYPFWQSELYGAVFSALGALFEQQRTLSDRVFSKLDDKYRLSLKPQLPAWHAKEIKLAGTASETDNMILFEALTQTFFILRETGDGAVLLDDVDKIDTPSLQFFSSQFGISESGSLHFLSSLRSQDLTISEEKLLSLMEAMPELTTGNKVQKLELKPLQAEHIDQLTAKLFEGKTLSEASAKALLASSSGSPLFIVEALSILLLKGLISAPEDEWDLSRVKPKDIPSGLNDMLKERLTSMSGEAINILKMAAVLGEKINVPQLARMSKLKVQQILNALSDAQRALIIEEGPNPDEYVFSHHIGRAVLYSLIGEEERRQYHVRAAELEQEYGTQSPERIVGRLAYHFHNAGKLESATEMFSALKHQMESVHISKGTRKMLQKRIHSVALAKESPLETKDLSTALMIARSFRSCMQNLRLYPKENENVRNSLDQFMNHLVPYLAEKTEALAVSFTQETILFNGEPLPPYLEDVRLTQDFYIILNSFGLQGLLFLRGITQDEVIDFLEIFKRHPEDVIGQWDELLERLNISHIFPDRKVFVAVSERRVFLEDQKLHVQAEAAGDGSGNVPPVPAGPPISAEHIEELRMLLDEFTAEKQELLAGLESSGVNEQQLQNLADMLNQADIGSLATTIGETPKTPQPPRNIPPSPREPLPAHERYAHVTPDLELIKEIDNDLSLAFEDLISDNTKVQSKAAAWLAQQDPFSVAEAGFPVITSDTPLRFRKLAAGVIKKTGPDAASAFLRKLSVGMNMVPLTRALRVCDVFVGHPELLPMLREIGRKGPVETLTPIVNVVKQSEGEEADTILLEIFMRASGKTQWDIIPLFAERKMVNAVTVLTDYILPINKWEKEINLSLQEEVCRSLGVLRSLDATEALIAASNIPGISSRTKAKPDSIRAAATWALTQLPKDPDVDSALEKLRTDRSELVQKAAELAEFFRE